MSSATLSCLRRISLTTFGSGLPAPASAHCLRREIKGEAFNAQWSESSREHIEDLLAAVIDEKIGVVAGIIGRTESGDEMELELLLLPLAHAGQTRVRALGVLAPLSPPYWLGEQAGC